MPSTILSDNGASSGTAGIKTTGSNDGVLVLQTTTAGGTATTAVTIDTGQRTTFPTTIAVGGATPSTSGAGITFPATQSASSDANTLDDYEEGTWTPAFDLVSGSLSGQSLSGTYVKIGRQVTVTIYASTGTSSSAVFGGFSGLPFTSDNVNQRGSGLLRENNATGNSYSVFVNSNATTSVVRRYDNNSSISSSWIFIGSFTYFTP